MERESGRSEQSTRLERFAPMQRSHQALMRGLPPGVILNLERAAESWSKTELISQNDELNDFVATR
jgi:hypothetical protein